MGWSKESIKKHTEAAKVLDQIKDETFELIKHGNVTEIDVHYFVLKKYVEYGLRTRGHGGAIVGFGENTADDHNVPTNKKLKKEMLVMLDLWGALDKRNAPFADITWRAYYGKNVPEKIKKIANLVMETRDVAIEYIKKNIIPTGRDVSELVDNFVERYDYKVSHGIGHSLGYYSPHGDDPGMTYGNDEKLLANMGYTIEPGITIESQFGFRIEMDFYVSKDLEMIITTELQRKLVLL